MASPLETAAAVVAAFMHWQRLEEVATDVILAQLAVEEIDAIAAESAIRRAEACHLKVRRYKAAQVARMAEWIAQINNMDEAAFV
ncbi:hypothetical protein CLOM_g1214 [Closterium sp. NIES-68]|nr:hypothetical protein CLOM_g1214 [Closterium sp. NIES-68]GJP71419.1 hypothetical protein CLOP_g2249 [Closterium sp. NIES-67]